MRSRSAELRVLAAVVLWGTTGPVGALAHAPITPAALGTIRILTGGLVLLTWAVARPGGLRARPGLAWRHGSSGREGPRFAWRAVLVAAVATGVFQVAYFTSVARIGAALATALVFGLAPVGTGLWSWAAGRVPLTVRWILGTGCAVGGCVMLLLPAYGGQGDLAGVILAALAGVCYSTYTVAATRFGGSGHVVPAVAATLLLGGLVGIPWVVTAGPGLLAGRTVLAVAWLGPITTALAYMLFVHGLRGVDAPTAGTLSLAEPLVAALLGIGLLHERLTDPAVTGCALLAAGLLITAVPLPSRASGAAPDAVDQRGGQAPCARARSHPAARTARRTESRP